MFSGTRVVAVLLVAVVAAAPVAGLYFHVKDGETKCFIEEIPDETMVQGARNLGRRSSPPSQ